VVKLGWKKPQRGWMIVESGYNGRVEFKLIEMQGDNVVGTVFTVKEFKTGKERVGVYNYVYPNHNASTHQVRTYFQDKEKVLSLITARKEQIAEEERLAETRYTKTEMVY